MFVSKVRFASSTDTSSSFSCAIWKPALFTTMSSLPNSFNAVETNFPSSRAHECHREASRLCVPRSLSSRQLQQRPALPRADNSTQRLHLPLRTQSQLPAQCRNLLRSRSLHIPLACLCRYSSPRRGQRMDLAFSPCLDDSAL